MKITLIGLGVNEGDISAGALEALRGAKNIYARTALAPSYGSLAGLDVQPLDDVFKTCRTFDTLNKKLAGIILKAAREGDVFYCVDGAVSEDNACKIIMSRHKDTAVYEGVSKAARVASLAKIQSSCVTGASAYDLSSLKSGQAASVYDIDCFYAATLVKEKLSELFGEESDCWFVRGRSVQKIKVYEIDRQKEYDLSCAVGIEQPDFLHRERYDYADLLQLVRLLRAPGGCPWDRAQTNESIRINMVEEAYELVDAINKNDDDMIEEETGDVLLQAAFHTVLKEEQGAFNSGDVISRVVKKLIFRHSHIFGKDKAADEGAALNVWEKNKKEEKNMSTYGETVAAVPLTFPACMRAQKVQKRAAKAGLDYQSAEDAAKKLCSEVSNFVANHECGGEGLSAACGQILFDAVALCRLSGADSEQSLADATEGYAEKFIAAEKLALADGRDVSAFNTADWAEYLKRVEDAAQKH